MSPRYLIFMLLFVFSVLSFSTLEAQVADEEIGRLIEQADKIMYANPEQAAFYARKAIELPSEDAEKDQRVRGMLVYSQAEKLLGNFDSSIKILFDALGLVEVSDNILKGEVLLSIGIIYSNLADYNKAIEYNDKATSVFKSFSDSALIASSYNYRGIIHYNLGEFNIAEQFFLQSLSINRSLKLMKEIAGNLNNLCLYKGDFDEKIGCINEAIAINKNLNAQWSLAENYNNLAKQYYYAGEYEKSLKALTMSRDIADSIGAKELICDNYEYSSWVYDALGDYKSAYHSLNQLYVLSSLLQRSNMLRSLEQDVANKKLQEQKRMTAIREQDYRIEILKRNVFLLLILLVLMVLVILFLTKWYKRRKQIELMNTRYLLEHAERENAELKIRQQTLELENIQNILEDKRKDVTEFAIFLQSQNELLDNIRGKVKEGYELKNDKILGHLKKINLFILQYQDSSKNNNKLLISIEEKNQEFNQRLLKKHSDLTRGEQELASLLRINLTTKEISIVTGKNPKTINMNRYRLRKSLNLLSEENLNEYLQNI